MAILESLPHIEVSIFSGDERLEEFDDESSKDSSSSPNTITKYIECKDDAPFHFQVEKDANFKNKSDHLSFNCLIDGESVPGYSFAEQSEKGRPEVKKNLSHLTYHNGALVERSFKFSKLVIPEPEPGISQEVIYKEMARLQGVGELVVNVFRRGKWRESKAPKPKCQSKSKRKKADESGEENKNKEAVEEESLKDLGEVVYKAVLRKAALSDQPMLSHRASWGKPKIIREAPKKKEVSTGKGKANAMPNSDQDEQEQEPPAKVVRNSSFLDKDIFGWVVPIATFKFKYCSKASLDAILGRTKAEAELQPKEEPDLEQEIPASAPNATTKSASHPSTTTIDELTPNELNLLVLHNFDSSDVSMKQLKILARKNLEKLSSKTILKTIERDPDSDAVTDLDDLNLKELRLLALHELQVQQLSLTEIHRIASMKLGQMTTEEVKKAITTQSAIKREREEADGSSGPSAKKAKKASKSSVPEIIELSD